MNKLVKIGVLGCANIADRYVIPAICELNKKFILHGVASRNERKAKAFALKFGCSEYADYESLMLDSSLDAVYIPLPNQLHAEWIEKALNQGKHVLVEKSLACSFEDVLRLNNIAREKELVLVENFQFRFHSQLNFIRNTIESGEIGEVRCMKSSFGFPPFPDSDNIRYQKGLGGGALLDCGAYPLKLSQLLLGENIRVGAANLFYDKDKGVDIWGGAYLSQKDGNLFSEISFGFDNYYQCNVEVWGSKGRLYTNRVFTSPPGFNTEVEIETQVGKKIYRLPDDHHFKNMLNHFYHLIETKSGLEVEYRQNINQARLISELREKAND